MFFVSIKSSVAVSVRSYMFILRSLISSIVSCKTFDNLYIQSFIIAVSLRTNIHVLVSFENIESSV